jgi:pyruvate/2-oxoglutarate dehydrogenase complex dihydrolipoamide dehydrogenase (E3) component
MKAVQHRKRTMVEDLIKVHLGRYETARVELIMGRARFVAPRTGAVQHEGIDTKVVVGERVFLNLGTRAALPDVPGLIDAAPMMHVEALELERVPEHLVVLGGGYVGLELAQAMRRFDSEVTVIERGPQLAGREDPDVGAALLELFRDEGIQVLLKTEVRHLDGRSGTLASNWPASSWTRVDMSKSTSASKPPHPACGQWVIAPAVPTLPTSHSTTSESSETT